jgi:hypothetical protein
MLMRDLLSQCDQDRQKTRPGAAIRQRLAEHGTEGAGGVGRPHSMTEGGDRQQIADLDRRQVVWR